MNNINTPYDDVFRTLLNDCSVLIIPLINEVFHENYTGNEKIELLQNEHFINQQNGDEEKRITDSYFAIAGNKTRKYHIECQSTLDSSMLIRMFEYDTQIALDDAGIFGNCLTVTFPDSAIMYLRHNNNTPEMMKVHMKTPGGDVQYDIKVLKAQEYTIRDIFEKNLLFLIPFYIFTYEKRFPKLEDDEFQMEFLECEYRDIRNRLEQLSEMGDLDEFVKCTILDMSRKVLNQIARNYKKIREGVGVVMGGKILDYEAKDILNRGKAEGKAEGKVEGTLHTLYSLVQKGLLSLIDASQEAGMTEEVFLTGMRSAGYKYQ